ncbi:hypothetical protein OROMI_031256 [Orobanche minor]
MQKSSLECRGRPNLAMLWSVETRKGKERERVELLAMVCALLNMFLLVQSQVVRV